MLRRITIALFIFTIIISFINLTYGYGNGKWCMITTECPNRTYNRCFDAVTCHCATNENKCRWECKYNNEDNSYSNGTDDCGGKSVQMFY